VVEAGLMMADHAQTNVTHGSKGVAQLYVDIQDDTCSIKPCYFAL
jgi:hypothetical protein